MIRIPLFLLIIVLVALPIPAGAATLFTGTLGINTSVNVFDTDQFDLDLAFLDNQLAPTNLVRLFDDLVITPSNVGETYEATIASDPLFMTVVDRLTDASSEFIRVLLTEDEEGGLTEGRGPSENTFFLNGSPPVAPDPTEMVIESITLRIDRFVLLPNGQSGTDPPVDLSLTLTINGSAIPEPSTVWLLVCGLAILGPLLLRRRRRQFRLAMAAIPQRNHQRI